MSEKTGRGVLVDADGRRYEFVSTRRSRPSTQRLPRPDALWAGLDARTRLRWAYGLLFATVLVALAAVRRARRRLTA